MNNNLKQIVLRLKQVMCHARKMYIKILTKYDIWYINKEGYIK